MPFHGFNIFDCMGLLRWYLRIVTTFKTKPRRKTSHKLPFYGLHRFPVSVALKFSDSLRISNFIDWCFWLLQNSLLITFKPLVVTENVFLIVKLNFKIKRITDYNSETLCNNAVQEELGRWFWPEYFIKIVKLMDVCKIFVVA